MKWQIAEGIIIAWVVIKLVGPAGEREIEGYRDWWKRHPAFGPILLAATIIFIVVFNVLK